MTVTIEDFAGWKQSSTTKFVFKYLLDLRLSKTEALADGVLTSASVDATAMLTARNVGECLTLKEITEISYEDILNFYQQEIEEETNNEQLQ